MIAQRLRLLRQERRLTQLDASELIGISPRTYQDLEADKRPSYDSLLKVADYFEVSVDWLMGRTEDRRLH